MSFFACTRLPRKKDGTACPCLLEMLVVFPSSKLGSHLSNYAETEIEIIAFVRFFYAITQQDVEGSCHSLAASPELPSLLFFRSGGAAADSGDGPGKAVEAEIGGADQARNAEETKTDQKEKSTAQEVSMVCDRCGRTDFKNKQVLLSAFPQLVSLA